MNKFILPIITVALLVSCTKRDQVDTPDNFNVTTDRSTYAAGDTVHFRFSGTPENIVFWAGTAGKKYEYRDRTVAEGNILRLKFTSYSQYSVDQTNLKVLVSNDFNGVYDAPSVQAATWRDITDQAILSSGADNTPSGDIDLSSVASENKDMAVAFRYVTTTTSSTQNRWVIRSFNLDNVAPDGSVSAIATMSNAGWKAFSYANAATNWSISSAQLLTVRSFTELDDDWVVTKTFNPNKVSPDMGQAIKNITASLSEYGAVYTEPGTYRVTFVATNASYQNQASVVREMDITITP